MSGETLHLSALHTGLLCADACFKADNHVIFRNRRLHNRLVRTCSLHLRLLPIP